MQTYTYTHILYAIDFDLLEYWYVDTPLFDTHTHIFTYTMIHKQIGSLHTHTYTLIREKRIKCSLKLETIILNLLPFGHIVILMSVFISIPPSIFIHCFNSLVRTLCTSPSLSVCVSVSVRVWTRYIDS